MTKVIIKAKLNTSFGNIIVIQKPEEVIHVGDKVTDDTGVVYTVKRIMIPDNPELDTVSVVY